MRLRCYEGVPWDLQGKPKKVCPEAVRCLHLKTNRKFTRMSRLSTEFGWKHQGLVRKLEATKKAAGNK
eukprot:UN11199